MVKNLIKYATNLTNLAKEGKLDPLIGRKEQLERVMQILCKRTKNNPCLIGDPGVGKTVIIEGLAQRIIKGTVPLNLRDKQIYSLDTGLLIAGSSYFGSIEQRITNVVNEVKKSDGAIILFIDELHNLIGAGTGGSKAAADVANILKPALARAELTCIGTTTIKEYRKYIEKDAAFERRFQPVQVPEPSVEETIRILKRLRKIYGTHHNVNYTDSSLNAAAYLSHRYISGRFLPDKAIDLIDEAAAKVQVKVGNEQLNPTILNVEEKDIRQVVSLWTGIPVENVSLEETGKLLNLERTLKTRIRGQDQAVEAISRAICRGRVGLPDRSRPTASFLFTGPTGVGKTEVAKALAAEYFGFKEALIRLDMSEYMDKFSVTRLFGSPPGYVGYDEGGQLTEAVRRKPHTIILFDEIDKAHVDVLDVLLQILDDGRLTDNKGRTIDFTNTIIIMTSNVGGLAVENNEHDQQVKATVDEELKKAFRPEFLNRIDEVIVFRRLDKLRLREIVDIMLEEVYARLKEKNIELDVSERFKEILVEEGYHPEYGARPLRRAVVTLLEDKLAEAILKGSIKDGDSVTIDFETEENDIVVLCRQSRPTNSTNKEEDFNAEENDNQSNPTNSTWEEDFDVEENDDQSSSTNSTWKEDFVAEENDDQSSPKNCTKKEEDFGDSDEEEAEEEHFDSEENDIAVHSNLPIETRAESGGIAGLLRKWRKLMYGEN